jgi:hypothetical protein
VEELPVPGLANEDAGPAALLIYRSILVFSFGGGTIAHDGGISVEADFDLVRDQRIEIHTPALASLQVLRSGLDVPMRAIVDVVVGEDPLQESYVRFDDSRIEVVDELRQLALVAGRIGNGPAARSEQEYRDRK